MQQVTKRGVDEDSAVKLSRGRCHVDGLHLFEASERVALGHQLGDGPLVQCSGDQQDDVVDHVAVGDVVQERGQVTWMQIKALEHHVLP